MSLFPDKDVLPREIESWKGFADSLRAEDRKLFTTMLANCRIYATAINAKGEPFPTEALLMALVFQQQRMINWLIEQVRARKSA
ncbi:MAG TPA: hypothetical protein VFA15_06560 [Nitrososphaera sp.]|nr:hypothetical protein [uncultured Nitrososphaera sp.]HZT35562.1 hypothetical protein [Nitrososphaera sp.]